MTPPESIEYVPGPHPYLWIGDDDGCYGTLDTKDLKRFLAALPDSKSTATEEERG